jgi:hypothetical protein
MPAQNLPFGRSMRCQIADKIIAHIGGDARTRQVQP